MFQKDQWIVYGSTGVCRVAQIGPLKELSGADPDTLYYTLEPLCGTDIIYVPVDTQAFMRPVITRQQALDLIDRIPTLHEDHAACSPTKTRPPCAPTAVRSWRSSSPLSTTSSSARWSGAAA